MHAVTLTYPSNSALSIRSANLPDPITQATSQERPQGDAISVADTRCNLVDAVVARLQQMDGAFHS